jgi:hypothetical protein
MQASRSKSKERGHETVRIDAGEQLHNRMDCAFCQQEFSVGSVYFQHVSGHLIRVALFALPRSSPLEHDDTSSQSQLQSDAANGASRTTSGSSDARSRISLLLSDDAPGPQRPPPKAVYQPSEHVQISHEQPLRSSSTERGNVLNVPPGQELTAQRLAQNATDLSAATDDGSSSLMDMWAKLSSQYVHTDREEHLSAEPSSIQRGKQKMLEPDLTDLDDPVNSEEYYREAGYGPRPPRPGEQNSIAGARYTNSKQDELDPDNEMGSPEFSAHDQLQDTPDQSRFDNSRSKPRSVADKASSLDSGPVFRSIESAQIPSLESAILDVINQTASIRRKIRTLVDYYIYPEPVPTEIAAYDPRLAVLHSRLEQLNKLDRLRLTYIFDNSDALVASYVLDMLNDLMKATDGIHQIFLNHYDRSLESRRPFHANETALLLRERQLKRTMDWNMTDLTAEDRADYATGAHLCTGAISIINGRDRGKIDYVHWRDLLAENRARLDSYGGAYLWWNCPDCEFRIRYHISDSAHSDVNSTNEVRKHPRIPAEYRIAFLVKSHLPQSDRLVGPSTAVPPTSKYVCVFCLAMVPPGTALDSATFRTGRELTRHIASYHRAASKRLQPLLLAQFKVAVKGILPDGVRRWDFNLTGTKT